MRELGVHCDVTNYTGLYVSLNKIVNICWNSGMSIREKPFKESPVKRFEVQYPISAYVFPTEARIHKVWFDEEYMHIALTDGRQLSVPLWWIPTVYNAEPEEREKFEISRDRTMIIWDPEKCAINDEISIFDLLGPVREEVEEDRVPAEYKTHQVSGVRGGRK